MLAARSLCDTARENNVYVAGSAHPMDSYSPDTVPKASAMPVWKRSMDIIGAGLILVFLSPLLFLIALMIRIISPGPALFRQDRIGLGRRTFTILKFRTMKHNADTSRHRDHLHHLIESAGHTNDGSAIPMAKLDDDPQIIPLGGLFRKTGLDELPQLINVLRGEMSLVGPRPPIPYEVEHYQPWHLERFNALPGITGLWQVSGKNMLNFREMIDLDIHYARNIRFTMDLWILCRTPWAVLGQLLNKPIAVRPLQRDHGSRHE